MRCSPRSTWAHLKFTGTTAHVNHPFAGSQGRDGKEPFRTVLDEARLALCTSKIDASNLRVTDVPSPSGHPTQTNNRQTIAPATHDLCHFINACACTVL